MLDFAKSLPRTRKWGVANGCGDIECLEYPTTTPREPNLLIGRKFRIVVNNYSMIEILRIVYIAERCFHRYCVCDSKSQQLLKLSLPSCVQSIPSWVSIPLLVLKVQFLSAAVDERTSSWKVKRAPRTTCSLSVHDTAGGRDGRTY